MARPCFAFCQVAPFMLQQRKEGRQAPTSAPESRKEGRSPFPVQARLRAAQRWGKRGLSRKAPGASALGSALAPAPRLLALPPGRPGPSPPLPSPARRAAVPACLRAQKRLRPLARRLSLRFLSVGRQRHGWVKVDCGVGGGSGLGEVAVVGGGREGGRSSRRRASGSCPRGERRKRPAFAHLEMEGLKRNHGFLKS